MKKRPAHISTFVSDLTIDKSALDLELEKQPVLYWKWAEQLAHAKNEVDEAKNQLELTEAILSKKIRLNPSHYGIDGRVTDKGVEKAVIVSKEYQIAMTDWIAARHKVNLMEGMTEAMDHKKSSIHNLCYQQAQGYFQDTHKMPDGVRNKKGAT